MEVEVRNRLKHLIKIDEEVIANAIQEMFKDNNKIRKVMIIVE